MPPKLLCVAVAARRGADGFQKHTWMELPAETTLRAVGRSICPDGELLHVEARKDIDGELSEFAGGMLDRDLAFVVGVASSDAIPQVLLCRGSGCRRDPTSAAAGWQFLRRSSVRLSEGCSVSVVAGESERYAATLPRES